jgi:predicted nuclease with TOPRIM domain
MTMENALEKQLRQRLTELKAEFEKGQRRLEDLEAEATRLRQTLLRISGAVQVLEEELEKAQGQRSEDGSPAENRHDG